MAKGSCKWSKASSRISTFSKKASPATKWLSSTIPALIMIFGNNITSEVEKMPEVVILNFTIVLLVSDSNGHMSLNNAKTLGASQE
jgi:hypothetical protein